MIYMSVGLQRCAFTTIIQFYNISVTWKNLLWLFAVNPGSIFQP